MDLLETASRRGYQQPVSDHFPVSKQPPAMPLSWILADSPTPGGEANFRSNLMRGSKKQY